MILPIAPMVRPSVLDGHENGQLPASLLFPTGIPGLSMVKPAQRSMTAMVLVMMSEVGDDLEMRQVGGYRDLAGQWRIFGGSAARYRPVSQSEWAATPTNRRKTWRTAERNKVAAYLGIEIADSDYWVKIRNANGSYPATAAVPGTSNHGWALAADLAQEYDDDSAADGIQVATVAWLVDNAADFGYSAESQDEPWHWRYVAGDAIPQRVLDVETFLDGTTPPIPDPVPPAPTPDEDDMLKLIQPTNDAAVLLLDGLSCTWVPGSALSALLSAGLAPSSGPIQIQRAGLKALVLVGPAPAESDYVGATQPGRTVPSDFAGHRPGG